MRRKTARPYGPSVSGMRLVSMLGAILVLWMLYQRLKDPATWRAIADDRDVKVAAAPEPSKSHEPENLVPGPNDQDENEVTAIEPEFEAVDDRAPLKLREMRAYWRLMDWSRTQPFAQMEERALDDLPFTKLWEEPERYRGKLMRLRLHVRRVVEWDNHENQSGIAKVWEASGSTDESRSFPYIVVFPQLPQGFPVGTDVRAEVDFVGYFLKILSYRTEFNLSRGAPLLVGRVKLVSSTPIDTPPSKFDPWIIPIIVIGGTAFIGLSILMTIRSRGKSQFKMLPKELCVADSWSIPNGANSFGPFDANQSPSIQLPSKDPLPHGTLDIVSDSQAAPTEEKSVPSEIKKC